MAEVDTSGAFIYAFPVYEMAKLRWNALYDRGNAVFTGLNRFWHQERLATHADRWVTTPNVDTLYSTAWMALDQGPVRLDIPPTDGRYLSIAMLDMFTDNFAIISPRNCGSSGASIVIAGPNSPVVAPENTRIVHAPSNDVLLFARVLAGDGEDVRRARACQEQLKLTPLGTVRELPPLQRSADPGEDSVLLLRDALQRNPPRAYEEAMRKALLALGLIAAAPGQYADARQFAGAFGSHFDALRGAVAAVRRPANGWTHPHGSTGDFGTFYRLRANVALGGLLALPQTEAVYLGAMTDADGAPLDGAHRYLLQVPPGGVPCDSFWSLTMYEDEPNGARYLVDNPIARYCINDRTPGLKIAADGSIDIYLQRDPPAAEAQQSNWLPAPKGSFRVILRAYLPRASLIDNRFRMPPVTKIV